jgi:hypothetical protein
LTPNGERLLETLDQEWNQFVQAVNSL